MSVDETLLLFKGKYKYRQHIRGKPNATGLKLYILADNTGYIWHFWMYAGHQGINSNIIFKLINNIKEVQLKLLQIL